MHNNGPDRAEKLKDHSIIISTNEPLNKWALSRALHTISNFHILTLPETRFHSIPSTKSRPHSPTHLRLESLTRPHHRVEWLVKLSGKFHVGKSLKFNIIKFNKVSKLLSQLLVQVSRTLCQILVEFGPWTMDHLSIILLTFKFLKHTFHPGDCWPRMVTLVSLIPWSQQ